MKHLKTVYLSMGSEVRGRLGEVSESNVRLTRKPRSESESTMYTSGEIPWPVNRTESLYQQLGIRPIA